MTETIVSVCGYVRAGGHQNWFISAGKDFSVVETHSQNCEKAKYLNLNLHLFNIIWMSVVFDNIMSITVLNYRFPVNYSLQDLLSGVRRITLPKLCSFTQFTSGRPNAKYIINWLRSWLFWECSCTRQTNAHHRCN